VTHQAAVVCLGDLFVQYLLPEVSPGATAVIGVKRREIGGGALNICWYLGRLGVRTRLVGPFSMYERRQLRISQPLGSRVIWTSGPPDTLIVLSSKAGHQAVYLCGELPDGIRERLTEECRGARQIIFAGSRHPEIRHAFIDLVRTRDLRGLIFSPSYAVYEFTRRELQELVRGVELVILNEGEAQFVCSQLGCPTSDSLAKRVGDTLIITLAERGAELYGPSGNLTVGSLSGITGDVLGAGDAFLAGYLYETARGSPSRVALDFASAIAAQVARARKVRAAVRRKAAQCVMTLNHRDRSRENKSFRSSTDSDKRPRSDVTSRRV
jgi:sugar/nucleoside kinase (ribokinase family)